MESTRKKLFRETPFPRLGTVVITASYDDGRYETRIIGGALDGADFQADDEASADRNHIGACLLVERPPCRCRRCRSFKVQVRVPLMV